MALIINTILILEFLIIVVYSLKFFNLEVPNDDIAWSHNTSNGLYFKLMLKLTLCSQELYRGQLGDPTVCIICMAFVLVLEILIIMYRINTPNIFNSIVHDYTLLMESLMISLTAIGLISLIPNVPNLKSLRTLRVFRPLRSINAVPSMKRQVATLLMALPPMGYLTSVLLFFIGVFAILGV